MAKELDFILDHQEANPAASCIGENGSVSFLDQIICPIYETMAAVCYLFLSFFHSSPTPLSMEKHFHESAEHAETRNKPTIMKNCILEERKWYEDQKSETSKHKCYIVIIPILRANI